MSEYWILGGFFAFVMGGVFTAGYWLLRQPQRPANQDSEPDLLKETFLRVGKAIPANEKRSDQIRRRLTYAGHRDPTALPIHVGAKIAASAMGLTILAVLAMLRTSDWDRIALPALAGAAFGFMLPDRLLEAHIRRRSRQLRAGLPATLDLLILSLEAGQSLDTALAESAREIRPSFPELSRELALVQVDLRAGKSRAEAFRNLGARNDELEVRRLAQVLVDSDRFGTSLAPALRTHVHYLRVRIRQTTREKARKVGVKLVFPIFFLIFPSIMLVTLGPAVLHIQNTLTPLMQGTP